MERGTVEVAQAIAEAEATALVASAGGPLVRQIERAGGIHITLPLTTKSPFGIWRNAAALEALILTIRCRWCMPGRERRRGRRGWRASGRGCRS